MSGGGFDQEGRVKGQTVCAHKCLDVDAMDDKFLRHGGRSVSIRCRQEGRGMVIALDECHSTFVLRGKENSASGACVLLWQELHCPTAN